MVDFSNRIDAQAWESLIFHDPLAQETESGSVECADPEARATPRKQERNRRRRGRQETRVDAISAVSRDLVLLAANRRTN